MEQKRKWYQMKRVWLIGFIFILIILGSEDDSAPVTPTTLDSYVSPIQYPKPVQQVPVQINSNYKYNSRSGYSGNYGYNYDVEGYSDSGDYFSGSVDTSGKYGDGYVYDDYGNEIYVETEWVDYGVMEATDEDGNTYEFEVE